MNTFPKQLHSNLSKKNFQKVIEKRTIEMQTGKVKTYTWREVQLRAKRALRKALAKTK